jgi:hypothetical protein
MQLDWAAADLPIVQQFVRENATGVDSNRWGYTHLDS